MSLEEQHDCKSEFKRKRSESPVSTSTTCDHADHSEGTSDEYRNKRVKTERPASPAPSFLSLKTDLSIPPPDDIKEEVFPLDFRERPASPTPSYMSVRTDMSIDAPNNFKREQTFHMITRVKTERPASPAPSFLSLKSDLSIPPPDDIKEEVFPLDFRERPASPTPSYMSVRTDISIDAPNNFKREQTFHMITRVGSERAPSPTLSSVSELTECFVEQPTNLKAEETYRLSPRVLKDNYLKCPLCKSILKDPVSIPCGHNFCRDCLNSSWDSCVEDYVCPQCKRGYKIYPELNTNTTLAEVVKHVKQEGYSPALPSCSYAGPEDVACDICSVQKLKAVKTCLTCGAVLCETHIKSHYTIPALQKHTLCDVTDAIENKLSTQNLPTDNISSICEEQEKDRSMSESGLNTSMANEAPGISTPETDVNKDITNATNLELMYSKLQQEVLGLKESISELKKHNTTTDKYEREGSDDEDSYKDSDEEENENSYEEDYNDDMDNDSEMDKSDENDDDDDDDDDEYDEDEYQGYDEEEDNEDDDNSDDNEYDEYDDDSDDSDEKDEYDVDEYGY